MTHAKTCHLGGYRGPTDCCEGKCLHRVNCNCKANDRVTKEYVQEQIAALRLEIARLEAML